MANSETVKRGGAGMPIAGSENMRLVGNHSPEARIFMEITVVELKTHDKYTDQGHIRT